jgi:hypothetical protein
VGRLEAVDMVGQRTGHFTQYVPTSNGPHKGQIWVLLLALSLVLTPFNPLLWPSSLIQDPATKDAVA